MRLKPTKKIIRTVRDAYPNLKIVGFKAETNVPEDELAKRAEQSMYASRLDIVVANEIGSKGMGTDENKVMIIDRKGNKTWVEGKKMAIARSIIDKLSEVLR